MSDEGRRRLESAVAAFERVRHLTGPALDGAEADARAALASARSAMDWLEDTDEFEAAHDLLHRIGRFTRTTWGCSVEREGQQYWRTCPADLAHERWGMSPGLVIGASECSICGLDPSDPGCPHITGRTYGSERCSHLITQIKEVLEVSVVSRPAQPDARATRVEFSAVGVQETQIDGWAPGMTASCDLCIHPCGGFSDLPAHLARSVS